MNSMKDRRGNQEGTLTGEEGGKQRKREEGDMSSTIRTQIFRE